MSSEFCEGENRLQSFRQQFGELIGYCLIGVTGALLDAFLFWLMTKSGLFYQYANFISVTCGIINNFFLNAFFNFKVKNRLLRRFFCFYAVGLFGWLISAVLLWFFIEKMGVSSLHSKIIIIFIVTAVQFTLNKLFTFSKKAQG